MAHRNVRPPEIMVLVQDPAVRSHHDMVSYSGVTRNDTSHAKPRLVAKLDTKSAAKIGLALHIHPFSTMQEYVSAQESAEILRQLSKGKTVAGGKPIGHTIIKGKAADREYSCFSSFESHSRTI